MKNIFYCLILFLGTFMLSSCDPTQDQANGDFLNGVTYENNTNNGGTGTPAGRVLKQLKSHLKDDMGQYEDATFTYNYTGTRLTSHTDDTGEVTRFDYNSSNKISKLSSTGQTSVFTYSGGNLSTVVTEITGIAKMTATYTFTGGKLSKIISIQEYSLPFPIKSQLETTYEFQGENMTKSVTKSGVYNPVTGDLEMSPEINTVSFTYDNKKSPYKLLPLEYHLSMIGIAPQGGNYLSGNNAEKVTISNSGASGTVMTFSHSYDSQNYPTKSTAGQDYIEYKYQ